MKQALLSFTVLAFVFTLTTPITVEAGCSYTGYINSGGQCAKSWHKKNKWEHRYYDEDKNEKKYVQRYRSTHPWSVDSEADLEAYIDYLMELIEKLEERRDRLNDDDHRDKPVATTRIVTDIEADEAVLRGTVDMNDFRNGQVFFIYGEDEDAIDDARDEDTFDGIQEDGDDLQKVIVDNELDGNKTYGERVTGLDDNTDHYFTICVEYEDEDDDETLECGTVRTFETD